MPENKMKIFLAICFFLIAVLAYNDRQNVMRQETMHQTAVIPSIDNVYQAIDNDDTGLLKKALCRRCGYGRCQNLAGN